MRNGDLIAFKFQYLYKQSSVHIQNLSYRNYYMYRAACPRQPAVRSPLGLGGWLVQPRRIFGSCDRHKAAWLWGFRPIWLI